MKARRQPFLLKLPFFLAAIWAAGASLYILLAPYGTGMSTKMDSSGQIIIQNAVESSFYDVEGLWGVALLAIFALLYLFVAVSALKHTVLLAVFSFVACTLTFLAGFSIGFVYFPAMLAVIVGWLALGLAPLISRAAS